MNLQHILAFTSLLLSFHTGVSAKTLTLADELDQKLFINATQLELFREAYENATIPFLDSSTRPAAGSEASYTLLANILNTGYRFGVLTQVSDMDTAENIGILYSECSKTYYELFLNAFRSQTSVGIQDVEKSRQKAYLDKYLFYYRWSVDGKEYKELPSAISPQLFSYLKEAALGEELSVPGLAGTIKFLGKEPTEYLCRVCDVEIYHVIVPQDPKVGKQQKLNPEYFTIMNVLNQIAAEQHISPSQQQFLDKWMSRTTLQDVKLVNLYRYSLVSKAEQLYFPSNIIVINNLIHQFLTCQSISDIEAVKNIFQTSSPVLYTAPKVIEGVIYIAVFKYGPAVENEEYVKKVLIDNYQVNNIELVQQINREIFEGNAFVYDAN